MNKTEEQEWLSCVNKCWESAKEKMMWEVMSGPVRKRVEKQHLDCEGFKWTSPERYEGDPEVWNTKKIIDEDNCWYCVQQIKDGKWTCQQLWSDWGQDIGNEYESRPLAMKACKEHYMSLVQARIEKFINIMRSYQQSTT